MPEAVSTLTKNPQTALCPSDSLIEGGLGVRFEVANQRGEKFPAFVIRFNGQAFAYLNRCAHQPMEMDWREGQFFESSGLYLMCATHGAEYEPDTGLCVGGPCRGARLQALQIEEKDGWVHWLPQPVWTLLAIEAV